MSIPILAKCEELINNKSTEIQNGVTLTCGEEVNLSIFSESGNVVIKFGSPAVRIHIDKMGPLKILNALRPTVEKIIIKQKSIVICVDNAPDVEIERVV